MLPLRYKWLWLAAGVLALVVILVLALAPLQQPAVSGGDKALHALAFAFLTVWFLGMFEPRLDWRVAAALVAYGILIELLQDLSEYRYADPYDFLADVAGISAGWLLAAAGLRSWCGRVEALLGVRTP
jgi:VanZ family protein